MPPGRISHAAGPTEEGWRVVDVWESQEAYDTFLHERLSQALQNAGMAAPPSRGMAGVEHAGACGALNFREEARLLKNSLVAVSGPRFGCREHLFGPFEPGSIPPIGPMGSNSTGSSPLSRRFALPLFAGMLAESRLARDHSIRSSLFSRSSNAWCSRERIFPEGRAGGVHSMVE